MVPRRVSQVLMRMSENPRMLANEKLRCHLDEYKSRRVVIRVIEKVIP